MKSQLIKQTCPCCGKEVEGEEVEVKFGLTPRLYYKTLIGAGAICNPGILKRLKNEDENREEGNCSVINCAFHCDDCDFDWTEDVKILDY